MRRVAVLSVHSCPLAALGGKETGGMNVYVRELSRQMGRLGIGVDVFTRSQNPHISPIVPLGQNARVVHIKAGPEEPVAKHRLLRYMPEFGRAERPTISSIPITGYRAGSGGSSKNSGPFPWSTCSTPWER
jgi:hypothetical protein